MLQNRVQRTATVQNTDTLHVCKAPGYMAIYTSITLTTIILQKFWTVIGQNFFLDARTYYHSVAQ